MASKKNETTENTAMVGTDPDLDWMNQESPGEKQGFVDKTLVDVDAYWKPALGLAFCGKILRAFVINNKGDKRTIVCVELSKSTLAKPKGEEDLIKLKEGQILGVGLSHSLLGMLEYIEHNGTVFAKVTGQKQVGRPQPMWVYELKLKGEKSAPPQLVETDQGEVPF